MMENHDTKFITRLTASVCAFLILACGGGGTAIYAQTLDTTFQGNIQDGGTVRASAVQADGKILIAGAFTFINNAAKNNILRLNADGSLDASFDAGAGVTRNNISTNSSVSIIVLQSDGKILISGFFDNYNGVPRNRLARLNADGSLDSSFNVAGGFATVNAVAVQPDGKILIGGDFSNYGGISQTHFARLNSDGSNDVSFNSQGAGADNTVNAIAVQPDGKILIGGNFTNYGTNPRSRIARINADGTFDAAFNNGAGASAPVSAISLQTDGKILIGGSFGTVNGTNRGNIARLNSDASLDGNFNQGTGANNSVSAISVQADGGIFISGGFTAYNGTARNNIARLNADGSLDAAFNTGAGVAGGNATVITFAVQANKIYVGGSFKSYNNVARSGIARLNTDGSLDASFGTNLFFNPNSSTGAATMVLQSDGKILIGGVFAGYDGVVRNGIARLNADGALDASFNPATGIGDGGVTIIILQPDGKILIAGLFTSFNGTPQKNIARLNSDGSLDATFNIGTGANSTIRAIALQANGKILVGGFFTNFNGVAANYLARLNADGSLDSSFNTGAGPSSFVQSIVVQPSNGKILIGGIFTSFNAVGRNGIARLNTNGSLDDTFSSDISPFPISVDLIVLQPDQLQPEGKILITGGFGSAVSGNFTRLNSDGSRDTSFNTGTGPNSAVYSIVVQPDGKILIGGGFISYNGAARNRFARLNINGTPDSFNSCTAGPNADVSSIALQSGRILFGGYFTIFNGVVRNGIARVSGGEVTALCRRTPFDFDGDGRADFAITRSANANSQATWWIKDGFDNSYSTTTWGLGVGVGGGDKAAPADYDGDGKTDIAVWRDEPTNPDKANFYILQSQSNTFRGEQFGRTGDDPSVVGDYDNDGKADLAVYRAGASAGQQSYWFYRPSGTPGVDFRGVPWGVNGDVVVPGDYDGDGKYDFCVRRGAGIQAQFILLKSLSSGIEYINWGLAADTIAPGDYDGDGKTDFMVVRASGGDWNWYLLTRAGVASSLVFGKSSADFITPRDYDGDGKADIAVWRGGAAAGAQGVFYVLPSSGGGTVSAVPWGTSGDYPTAVFNTH